MGRAVEKKKAGFSVDRLIEPGGRDLRKEVFVNKVCH